MREGAERSPAQVRILSFVIMFLLHCQLPDRWKVFRTRGERVKL